MDKQAAKRLIEDTFSQSFDDAKFRVFIRNLVNNIDETKAFEYHGQYIPDSFKQHITQYKRVGKYVDSAGDSLDVLVVHLRKESALERARTKQRNFVGWYLNGGRGDILRDAALAAFVAPGEEDWRFSLVRIEYKQELTDSGRIKVREELTPARRYSFLVGENEPNHTAQQQIVPILQDDRHNPAISELEQAFSVEAVTKQFYLDYRGLFESARDALQKLVGSDSRVQKEFEAKLIDPANFAKKLLGQIVFLYFLQKKGWLGVGKDGQGNLKPWGTGPKNFLQRLFNREFVDYGDFFNDVLEPLFYDALATEHDYDYYPHLQCKIPFLNGGLFEAIHDYNWREIHIPLPNNLFQQIFDTFDLYNFTVREDEPLEKEVAIDPEMLGKVFENLLPENLRKGKGTYYTPRPIVHYMCQESLINYLAGKCEGIIPKEDIEELVHCGESAVENDTVSVQKRLENKDYKGDYKPIIQESIRDNAQLLDDKLAEIKVCDPAVGSGAFPVGMMHEIVKARNVLTTYLPDKGGRDTYALKRHCIQESLYGVDIDPGAIDIAKLRLWLSLIVDEEDYARINPLPNLDYKIMQGNSLIEDFHGISLNVGETDNGDLLGKDPEMERLVKVLHEKQNAFFNATHPGEKRRLKDTMEGAILAIFHYRLEQEKKPYFEGLRSISKTASSLPENLRSQYTQEETEKLNKRTDFDHEAVENELREMTHGNKLRSFFPWRLYFADVFREEGGFDVVIANPPYVSVEKFARTEQQAEWKCRFKTYASRGDIYCFFYEQGLGLLRDGGTLTFISSNKFQRAGYGKGLRQLLAAQRIQTLIDFCELPVFAAATDPMIVIVAKSAAYADHEFPVLIVKDETEFSSLPQSLATRGARYKAEQLKAEGWSLEGGDGLALVEKLRSKGTLLGDYVNGRLRRGILTGLNEAFVIDRATRDRLIRADRKSAALIKPWIRGKDIKRWRYVWSDLYLIQIESSENTLHSWSGKSERSALATFRKMYPAIADHLLSFEKPLRLRTDQGTYFWELRSCDYWSAFAEPKIVFNETSKRLHAYVDTEGNTINKTGFIILTPNTFFVLAVLNSTPMDWLYRATFPSWGDPWNSGRVQFRGTLMKQVPIPASSATDKVRLTKLAEQVAKLTAVGNGNAVCKIEREIDEIVYRLFDLTPDEIAHIEKSLTNTGCESCRNDGDDADG